MSTTSVAWTAEAAFSTACTSTAAQRARGLFRAGAQQQPAIICSSGLGQVHLPSPCTSDQSQCSTVLWVPTPQLLCRKRAHSQTPDSDSCQVPHGVPKRARRLCELSPVSLRTTCSSITCRLGPHNPALSSLRVPGFHLEEYMGSAMRLLGYQERSTLWLGIHCFRQVEHAVLMTGLHADGATDEETKRCTALGCLWVAAKCEEVRESTPKAMVVATLLPARLAHRGCELLFAWELWIMQRLDWNPYRGFLP